MRFLRTLFGGYEARRIYRESREATVRSAAVLARSHDPYDRMFALLDWAECELTMAQNAHGFARADRRDEAGRTLADAHEVSASLLGWVAATEAELAWVPGMVGPGPARHHILTAEVRLLLGMLAEEARPVGRGDLVLALHDAVVTHAGRRAAAVLAVLAANYYVLEGMSRADIVARVWASGLRDGGGDVVSG